MDGVGSDYGRCSRRWCSGFGMCDPRGYAKTAQMGGLVSETSCFTEIAGQGRTSWRGILRAWFSSKVSPGLARLCLDARGSVSRKALGCCAHWRAEFEGRIPFSRSSGEGRWGVLSTERYSQVRSPVPHLLPHPLQAHLAHGVVSMKPGWQWAAGLSASQWWLTRWDANLDSVWITGESLSSLEWHFLTNDLHVVLYCVQKHLRAVLGWSQPPPLGGHYVVTKLNQEQWHHYTGAEPTGWSCCFSGKQWSLRASQFYSSSFLVCAVMYAFSWPWEVLLSFLK